MSDRHFLTSVCRIADLAEKSYEVAARPRRDWASGDYVVAEVRGKPSSLYRFELTTGRLMDVMESAHVVGALGKRTATLEATGDWEAVADDGAMHALTGAGLFGKALSVAPILGRMMDLQYLGHVCRDGEKLSMPDFVAAVDDVEFSIPTILLIGTSMSSGKTTAGRVIIHELKRAGLRVAGAKFTGAGRYRDILSFQDAGADVIVDFVDAGMPSTVVPRQEFTAAMRHMLNCIADSSPDVLVAEAGASPLEPYNGDTAVSMLGENVRCTVLCASDPYAVVGVQKAFGIDPDIVAGPAANTEAGIDLVEALTGLRALNLLSADSAPQLTETLASCLSLPALRA